MKKVIMLFPGQGSQYVGMGKKLYQKFPIVKEYFDITSEVLGRDLWGIINGNEAELTNTINAQPAIFTLSCAIYKVFSEEIGIEPILAAGHSLGEISALVSAGAIDFENGARIVKKRSELMGSQVQNGDGVMAAVTKVDSMLLNDICSKVSSEKGSASIANYNSSLQTVISGGKEQVLEAIEQLKNVGVKARLLNVSTAFHSPYMKPIAEEFRRELDNYHLQPLKFPVFSNVTADFHSDENSIKELLYQQLFSPVRWKETMDKISQYHCKIVEVGPKTILKNLAKKDELPVHICSLENDQDLDKVKTFLFPNTQTCTREDFLERCLGIIVCTENKNFNDEEYNQGVVKPYNTIKDLMYKIKESNRPITDMEIKEGLDLLKYTLVSKKCSDTELKERINQLLVETGTKNVVEY